MTHENSFGIAYTGLMTTTTYIAPSITQVLYKLFRVQQLKPKPHLYGQQNQTHFSYEKEEKLMKTLVITCYF